MAAATPFGAGRNNYPLQLNLRPEGRVGWLFAPYRVPIVHPSRNQNSDLISSHTHNGKFALTLQDAIELAIENNFDVELQRYNPKFATTEILRAQGGGLLRGGTNYDQ